MKGFPNPQVASSGQFVRAPYNAAQGDYVLMQRFDSQEADPKFYINCHDVRIQNFKCPLEDSKFLFALNPSSSDWGPCPTGCDSCCVPNDGSAATCAQCYLPTHYETSGADQTIACSPRGGDDAPAKEPFSPTSIALASQCTQVPNCAECSSENQCSRCLQGFRQGTTDKLCSLCGNGWYGNGSSCSLCEDSNPSTSYLTFTDNPIDRIADNFLSPILVTGCANKNQKDLRSGTIVKFVDRTQSSDSGIQYLPWSVNDGKTAQQYLEEYCGSDPSSCNDKSIPGIVLASCNNCNPTTVCTQCAGG